MEIGTKQLKILAQVWTEMNCIAARDGAPNGVGEEYWRFLMDGINDIVERGTGKKAWLNSILYSRE